MGVMHRTVVIGIDGATFAILDLLMKSGVMPTLAGCVAGGARADLMSTPNPLTPPAWTSLATGRTPGNHGVFDFLSPKETDSGVFITLTSARDVRAETIWALVSRLGGRAAVLNFPLTYPVRSVSGYVVPGFIPLRHMKRAMYPADLYRTLAGQPWFDVRELAMDLDREKAGVQGLPLQEYADWIRLHIRRERQWFEIFRLIMERDPCDLMAVMFDGTDKIQHLAWRFIDPACFPEEPTAPEREIRDLCLQYFRQLDGYIGQVLALAGPDTRVFIASDHGFGASVEIFFVNVWLYEHGYLQWGEAGAVPDDGEQILAQRMRTQYGLLDWAKTTAYALTPSSNGIYIRVARRPGQPGIRPEEYEAFRRTLVESLLAFRDPESGEPVVTRAMTREEAFPGRYMDLAPDVTLVLRDHGLVSILNADAPLKRRGEPKGMHRPEGIFCAVGPGIRRGLEVAPLSIVDVPSAVLYSLGLDIPSDFEGRLPEEIFESALLEVAPPVRGAATTAPSRGPDRATATPPALDTEEEAAVLSRLKALGYVE